MEVKERRVLEQTFSYYHIPTNLNTKGTEYPIKDIIYTKYFISQTGVV